MTHWSGCGNWFPGGAAHPVAHTVATARRFAGRAHLARAAFQVPGYVQPYSSNHNLSAVYNQRLTRDAARRIRAEENRRRGNVRALDVALERGQVHIVRNHFLRLDA